jgi:hypothetical protein
LIAGLFHFRKSDDMIESHRVLNPRKYHERVNPSIIGRLLR